MMSLRQKVIAIGVILGLDVVFFFVWPILGILAFFASLPMAIVVLRR